MMPQGFRRNLSPRNGRSRLASSDQRELLTPAPLRLPAPLKNSSRRPLEPLNRSRDSGRAMGGRAAPAPTRFQEPDRSIARRVLRKGSPRSAIRRHTGPARSERAALRHSTARPSRSNKDRSPSKHEAEVVIGMLADQIHPSGARRSRCPHRRKLQTRVNRIKGIQMTWGVRRPPRRRLHFESVISNPFTSIPFTSSPGRLFWILDKRATTSPHRTPASTIRRID